jgi:hypothetical protein
MHPVERRDAFFICSNGASPRHFCVLCIVNGVWLREERTLTRLLQTIQERGHLARFHLLKKNAIRKTFLHISFLPVYVMTIKESRFFR